MNFNGANWNYVGVQYFALGFSYPVGIKGYHGIPYIVYANINNGSVSMLKCNMQRVGEY